MRQSEQINEIAAALAKAQAKIKTAIKANTNPHFRSKYADLASVKDACSDALTANDIAVIQAHGFEGERFVLTTRLIHKSGQWLESVYLIKPVKDDPQGYASATTYARRISLSSMVGVVADEDDDGNAASQPRRDAPAPDPDRYEEEVSAKQRGEKAAKAFVADFVRDLGKAEGASMIDDLYGSKAAQITRLKAAYPDQYGYLQAALEDARAKFMKDAAE